MFKKLLFIFVLVFSCWEKTYATTLVKEKVICPVCNTLINTLVVGSTNNCAGCDMDLFERAAGDDPNLFYPITCPECAYSGFHSEFLSDTTLPDTLKQKIKAKKAFISTPPVEELDLHNIPAWAKYDFIAQKYQLTGRSPLLIAHIFHSASWAVRSEDEPLSGIDSNTINSVDSLINKKIIRKELIKANNPALYEIQLGRKLAKIDSTLKTEERTLSSLAAIKLLREHGENKEVEDILPSLENKIPTEQFENLKSKLNKSIANERYFQEQTVSFLKLGLPEARENEKTVINYLCGELYRRLKDWGQADSFFRVAESLIPKNGRDPNQSWLIKCIRGQKQLLPKNNLKN